MNRICLIVHVDPFADDDLYVSVKKALEDFGSQIWSEPVVDRVVICCEEDLEG